MRKTLHKRSLADDLIGISKRKSVAKPKRQAQRRSAPGTMRNSPAGVDLEKPRHQERDGRDPSRFSRYGLELRVPAVDLQAVKLKAYKILIVRMANAIVHIANASSEERPKLLAPFKTKHRGAPKKWTERKLLNWLILFETKKLVLIRKKGGKVSDIEVWEELDREMARWSGKRADTASPLKKYKTRLNLLAQARNLSRK